MHMGDHAYDMDGAGDKRGDSYMNAYQVNSLMVYIKFYIFYDMVSMICNG